MKKWETGRSNTGRGEERRESSQRPSAFSTVITRNLPGPVRPWEERDALPTSRSQQSCSNLFVEVPAVAKLNLNGQMSLLTRTERSVSFPNVTSSSQYPPPQNYLGHSINAPTGRWQKRKDVHWYNREHQLSQEERAEEIRKIKEAEAEALSVALYASLIIHLASWTFIHSHTQWVWAVKKRTILEHTRHGHKCDSHNSLDTDEWARDSRRGSKCNGEGRAKTTQKGAQGREGCKECQKSSPRGAKASCPQ